MEDESLFKLLDEPFILAILMGNIKYGAWKIDAFTDEITISMPYLTKRALCNICTKFDLPINSESDMQTREKLFSSLLHHCIQNNSTSSLLSFLFSKKQFLEEIRHLNRNAIDWAHQELTFYIIEEINKTLHFYDCELRRTGEHFSIHKSSSDMTPATPALEQVGREYLTRMFEEAQKEIVEGNYDSALTKARTLLEECFCYVIEQKGEEPLKKGEIGNLYKQVKDLYNMHHDGKTDERIRGLLSGLANIVSAVAEMRNKAGDAHGRGTQRLTVDIYHARLCVNSAITMAEFVLSVAEHAAKKQT